MGAIESKLIHLKLRFKSKLPHPHLLKRYNKTVVVEDDYCHGDHLGLLDGYTSSSCKFPVSNYYYDEDDFESDDERGGRSRYV